MMHFPPIAVDKNARGPNNEGRIFVDLPSDSISVFLGKEDWIMLPIRVLNLTFYYG